MYELPKCERVFCSENAERECQQIAVTRAPEYGGGIRLCVDCWEALYYQEQEPEMAGPPRKYALYLSLSACGFYAVNKNIDNPARYPVICLPLASSATIVDIDRPIDPADGINEWADAFVQTDHGVQVVVLTPGSQNWRYGALQDADYQELSKTRGYWSQRVFNKNDQTRRVCEAITPAGEVFACEWNALAALCPPMSHCAESLCGQS